MSERGVQVLEEALSLPPRERAELVERLLSSLDSPSQQRIDQLWAEEAESRVDAFERGQIQSVPAQEVFEAIRKPKA
jgi:putative addiction module component (TIGR02574 family)